MSTGPRQESEHDELIARLADLYIDHYWAEIDLHAASLALDPMENVRDVRYLVKAAHRHRIAWQRIADMKEGVSPDVLYGQLVIGTALAIAEQIRDERRARQEQPRSSP